MKHNVYDNYCLRMTIEQMVSAICYPVAGRVFHVLYRCVLVVFSYRGYRC